MNHSHLTLLLIAAGGMTGALARYGLSGLVQGNRIHFPYGTLVVNLLGCLLMGMLLYWIQHGVVSSEMRMFFGLGFLGAFTTYSAFSAEALNLLMQGNAGGALLYIGASVFGSLTAVTMGYLFAKAI